MLATEPARARSTLGGDLTDVFGYRHGGRPDRRDEYGVSKIDMYRLAIAGDEAEFAAKAVELWAGSTRNAFYRSQRIYIRQPGKTRPLDLPPEWKRLVLIYMRERVHERLAERGGLLSTIIGFRNFEDFIDYRGRTDGVTSQDLFAGTAINLLREVGKFAVGVDLRDAFRLLPHKAIHAALRELGLCREDRALIIDLVRINTRSSNGKIIQPRDEGIEQGGALSPLIFNVVIDLIFRRMYGKGRVRGLSYGDDLNLVAQTRERARADFTRFVEVTSKLGFTNIRPLDGIEAKASKIYNTDENPVPALKTFLINRSEIRLMPTCKDPFSDPIEAGDNRRTLHQKCKYKSVSTSYLRELRRAVQESSQLLGGNPEEAGKLEDVDPCGLQLPVVERENPVSLPPQLLRVTPEEVGTLEDVDPRGLGLPVLEKEKLVSSSSREDGLVLSSPPRDEPVMGACPSLVNDPVLTDMVVCDLYDTATNPSSMGDHVPKRKGTRFTDSSRRHPNGCRGGGAGNRSSSEQPVLALAPEHLASLGLGQRAKAGVQYQQHVLDVRGLAELSPRHVPHAVLQCLRLASTHGVSQLLVDPAATWVSDLGLIRGSAVAGWKLVRVREHGHGQVLVLRRHDPMPRREPKRIPTAAPASDLVLGRPRIDVANPRVVRVPTERGGARATRTVRVDTFTPRDAIRSAIAIVLDEENPMRVAIPALGGLKADLIPEKKEPKRYRLVPMASAMKILERWNWSLEADWLVGVRRGDPSSASLPEASARRRVVR